MLDVFDDMGRFLCVKPRDEVHQAGDWHRVFHCQIATIRNGVPSLVLQRRSDQKAAFPGLLDLSAAGHLSAGESPTDGVRELAEELGFSLGKLNYCLKALQSKGLIKIENFKKNPNKLNYFYVLTPKGIAQKTKLTLNYMKRKMNEYDELKKELKGK